MKNPFMLILARACIAMAFAGALLPGTLLAQTIGSSQSAAASSGNGSSNYRISPDDLIDVRVFQEPDLDSVIRISSDGTANFPLIGNVALGGKTIPEAVSVVQARYHDGYLVNPQVTLTLREYAKKRYTVLGQVQKPGSYTIEGSEQITLLQAIGIAGGYTRSADSGHVLVKRTEAGKERLIRINARKMADGTAEGAFILQPGDVVTVEESIF
jgi:polysaccharide export outer membrane protein